MAILVLAPADPPVALPAGVALIPCAGLADLEAALAAPGYTAAVLVTDGLPPEALPFAAEAVRRAGIPVIEVRAQRWDGGTFSAVSAACRGVISGFGALGVGAAVALLQAEGH